MHSPSEIGKLYQSGENRESVSSKDIPDLLKQAFIATEDRRFLEHSGVDFWAIGRALVKDIMHMSAVEGGSTITQQLAKNVFLSSEKTAFRKGTEMAIAFALDEKYDKDTILEKYLNRIYFGSRAYGIKAASKTYFGKSDLNKLDLWEIATLAALPKAPSKYSPLANPEQSKERRAVVLKLMADQGYITEDQRAKAAAVDYVAPPSTGSEDYATFVDYVINEAEDKYDISEDELNTKGYRIYTTMDPKAQQVMEKAYTNASLFQKDASDGQKIQSSMVIIDNKTGSLVAMIGGRDYQQRGFNRVFSQRQPGSSFKPIAAYGPALESGDWNPYSIMDDTQTNFNGYTPHNYDRTTHGQVSMFEAVKKSYNLAPVWLLSQISESKGMNFVMDFANKLGIPLNKDKDRNLAIALGGLTDGVSPLQMATAYTAFANQGVMNTTHAILKITDKDGKELKSYKAEPKQVIKPQTAYYMTLLLQGVVETGGTGTRAKFNRPVAGKTGTTGLDIKGLEKYDRDVWFVGYTPEWTAAVWEGFDKVDSKHYVTIGSGSPSSIFKEVMSKALEGKPVTQFTKPESVPDLTEPPSGVADLSALYLPETKSVKLTWTSLGDKIAYQVFRKGSQDAEPKQLIQSPTTEVNDTTVSSGESYQYYVVPVNLSTNTPGNKSNEAVVEIPKDDALASPLPSPGASPSPSPGTGVGNGKVPPSPTPSPSPGAKPTHSPSTGGNTDSGQAGKDDKGAVPSPSPKVSVSPKSTPTPSPTNKQSGNAVDQLGDMLPLQGQE
ncbi:transglycosylase domain-containing protein [Paenibacillus hexagrammi]|uniref:PBP1A family penicillin-binding protein n=1 Tax=Paenibacillus hexagrammi TaxID=2908839 RepID=A0ABY3SQ94_9BACL|nr:PBP1A family penicillin-binding protein [Paenibacillus sp. YPD9-1]UJF36017.1 PBP1A family penicillin-binding protein [Paenibacillus sp. YPD9-1]